MNMQYGSQLATSLENEEASGDPPRPHVLTLPKSDRRDLAVEDPNDVLGHSNETTKKSPRASLFLKTKEMTSHYWRYLIRQKDYSAFF